MTRRKTSPASTLRVVSLSLYATVVIVLGFFAKDNLVATVTPYVSTASEGSRNVMPSSGTIEVAFSPNSGATAKIIAHVAEARKTILVSAYSFTSAALAKALLDAKKRNVDVKIILDKSQMSQRYSSAQFFINQGFAIRIDVKHAIYHNKVMIIDDKTVITGSFNFTQAAETKNAENVIIIRDNDRVANLYKNNWRAHWDKALSPEEFAKR